MTYCFYVCISHKLQVWRQQAKYFEFLPNRMSTGSDLKMTQKWHQNINIFFMEHSDKTMSKTVRTTILNVMPLDYHLFLKIVPWLVCYWCKCNSPGRANMVSIRKKQQQNRRFLSSLDDFDRDLIICDDATSENQKVRVNNGPADRQFVFNIIEGISTNN